MPALVHSRLVVLRSLGTGSFPALCTPSHMRSLQHHGLPSSHGEALMMDHAQRAHVSSWSPGKASVVSILLLPKETSCRCSSCSRAAPGGRWRRKTGRGRASLVAVQSHSTLSKGQAVLTPAAKEEENKQPPRFVSTTAIHGHGSSTGKEAGSKAIELGRWSEGRQEQAKETKKRAEEEVRTLAGHKIAKEVLQVVREASRSQSCRKTSSGAAKGTNAGIVSLEETVLKLRLEVRG